MSQLDEARPLYEEELQGCRATLGNGHEDTLASMTNLADMLRELGEEKEAEALFAEARALGLAPWVE